MLAATVIESLALALGWTVAQPPLSPEVLASPFGIVCPWPGVGKNGMGAVWCRCGAGATELGNWPGLEPLPGVFRWASAEAEWDSYYARESLVPTPILGYTPRWASRSPEGDQAKSRPPADLWDYYRFCRAVAERFAGRVWYWEVWNEPNVGFFEGTIAEYTDLLKTAAVAVAAGSPGAYVVFGGMAGVDESFLKRCYAYGAGDYFDVMAAHPYQWGKSFDDGWFCDKLERLRETMGACGDENKPIWLNELGWSTGDRSITEDDQARLLAQAYATGLSRRDLGIERLFWFCVKDWGGPGYGLYAEDSRRKPAWHAYRAMVKLLGGLVCWGRVDVGKKARSYAFTDPERRRCMLILWSASLEPCDVDLSLTVKPAGAWDITGRPVAPPTPVGGKLHLQATPVPQFLEVDPVEARALVREVRPLLAATPDPGRRPRAWMSLYPQPGCSLPWLRRGERVLLRARVFNASGRALTGKLELSLANPSGSGRLAHTTVPVSCMPGSDTVLRLSLVAPQGAPDWAVLRLEAQLSGASLRPLEVPVLVGDGPCINFLANSHLERSWYLHGEARSSCSESMRFGSEWMYRLPVPHTGDAAIRMQVGAHQAGPWSVVWSRDGKSWQPMMEGRSELGWHEAHIVDLKEPSFYLRCKGVDQQVREVIVTYLPTKK